MAALRVAAPRLTGAWGSLGHALALTGASGEQAGQSVSHLVFDTGLYLYSIDTGG